MNRFHVLLMTFAAWVLAALPAAAQQQVVPPAPILVTTPPVTINNSDGDQTDPHVSKDLMCYTDIANATIRYYRFSTGVDAAVPSGPGVVDILCDVSGDRISFRRIEADRNALFVFDTLTSLLTEIDPRSGSNRIETAIGGNTVAYIDLSTGGGDLYAYDLAASPPGPPQVVSAFPFSEQNPNVAPDGNTIVWEQCQVSLTNCDVFKAVRAGSAWTASPVANTSDPEGNPDTDGTWIVYDANRTGNPTGQDIYYQPVAGGPETRLALPGDQANPSISRGIIAFENRANATADSDIFVYDIARNILYQVTSTASVNETLSDFSVLDNGDFRVVWSADDGVAGEQNIHGLTFTPVSVPAFPFARLSAGFVHTCALRTSGVVECWGNNSFGQAPASRQAMAGTFASVSAGTAHTCALTDVGIVQCWGNNLLGQAPAQRKARTGAFTEVSSGAAHTCALRGDGVVECWGWNIVGQAPATRSARTGAYVHVAAGGAHTCALRADGVVECWGTNIAGQAPPIRTAAVGSFVNLTAGTAHTCATRHYLSGTSANQDAAECWGSNITGQAPAVEPGSFDQVSAGELHTCGIDANLLKLLLIPPVLECWGDNRFGQAPPSRTPAPGGGNSFVRVSAGAAHTCAINQGGFVECWGNNADGQAPSERH